jgi:hypothetical protein
MTKSLPFDVEGLVRKSGTWTPFTLEKSKALLESLDLIEKDYDEEAVEKLPATAQLPSRSPTKTLLVAGVLLSVGELPFPRYRILL